MDYFQRHASTFLKVLECHDLDGYHLHAFSFVTSSRLLYCYISFFVTLTSVFMCWMSYNAIINNEIK